MKPRIKSLLPRSRRARLMLAPVMVLLFIATAAPSLRKGTPPGPHEAYGGRAETVIKDVSYVDGPLRDKRHQLDIYSNPHEGLWPVVVMIHGGAWMEGDKTMDNKVWICQCMAASGYVAFTINYRLWPESRLKKQAEDAMAAVIWVKQHAKEYGGDPARVGVIGGSAGGHLASLVAWASDDPYFIPTGVTDGSLDSDVKVAALYYPVIDLEETFKHVAGGMGPFLGSALVPKPYARNLKHLSPKFQVDKDCVPTIFLTGDADNLNLYPQSVNYTARLKALGVDAKLYTAPGKDHGFTWNYWEDESVQSVKQLVEFFDKYLK